MLYRGCWGFYLRVFLLFIIWFCIWLWVSTCFACLFWLLYLSCLKFVFYLDVRFELPAGLLVIRFVVYWLRFFAYDWFMVCWDWLLAMVVMFVMFPVWVLRLLIIAVFMCLFLNLLLFCFIVFYCVVTVYCILYVCYLGFWLFGFASYLVVIVILFVCLILFGFIVYVVLICLG